MVSYELHNHFLAIIYFGPQRFKNHNICYRIYMYVYNSLNWVLSPKGSYKFRFQRQRSIAPKKCNMWHVIQSIAIFLCSWSSVLTLLTPFRTVRSAKMNKSTLLQMSLGLFAVLSCLGAVVRGKPGNLCCEFPGSLPCCRNHGLKAAAISSKVKSKRREKAKEVKSTLLRNLHDAKAEGPAVEHQGVWLIEESHYRAWLPSSNSPQTVRKLSVSNRSDNTTVRCLALGEWS